MKEQDIIDLGFERHDVTAEKSGHESDWYYYTYEFTRGLSLISCDSDLAKKNGQWHIEIFNTDEEIIFTDVSKVRNLMDLITEAKQ